jgi:hypothetical protein
MGRDEPGDCPACQGFGVGGVCPVCRGAGPCAECQGEAPSCGACGGTGRRLTLPRAPAEFAVRARPASVAGPDLPFAEVVARFDCRENHWVLPTWQLAFCQAALRRPPVCLEAVAYAGDRRREMRLSFQRAGAEGDFVWVALRTPRKDARRAARAPFNVGIRVGEGAREVEA